MAVTFRISELAADLAVTTRTIRFYEEQGLISPSRRGHERIYTPHERHLLRIALTGKQLGLTLADCRELLDLFQNDDPSISEVEQLERIAHYQQFLSEQKRAITTLATTLNDIKARCEQPVTDTQSKAGDSDEGAGAPSLFVTSQDDVLIAADAGAAELHAKEDPSIEEAKHAQERRSIHPQTPSTTAAVAPERKGTAKAKSDDTVVLSQSAEATPIPTAPLPSAGHGDLDLFSSLEEDSDEVNTTDEPYTVDTHTDDEDGVRVEDDGQMSFFM